MAYANGKYIDCPFEEKDAVKARGARWDPVHKAWYVPKRVPVTRLAEWYFPDAHQQVLAFLCEHKDNGTVKDLGAEASFRHDESGREVFRWKLRPGKNPRPFRPFLQQPQARFGLSECERHRILDVLVSMDVQEAKRLAAASPARAPRTPQRAAQPHQPPAPRQRSPARAVTPELQRPPRRQRSPARAATPPLQPPPRQRAPPGAPAPAPRAAAHDEDDFSQGSFSSGGSAARFIDSDDDDSVGHSDKEYKPPADDEEGVVNAPQKQAVPVLIDSDGDEYPAEDEGDTCIAIDDSSASDAATSSGEYGRGGKKRSSGVCIVLDGADEGCAPRKRVRRRLFK